MNLNDYLPENVSIVGDQPVTATVTMLVERLEIRSFEYDADDIELTGQKDGYEYTLDAPSLTLQIRGLAEDLDTLDADDIRVRADVGELEPGVHPLRLEAELMDGFDFVSASAVNVSIEDLTAPADSENAGAAGPIGRTEPGSGDAAVNGGETEDGEEAAGGSGDADIGESVPEQETASSR